MLPIEEGKMKTDIDTCLRDIAFWYVKNRREMSDSELRAILNKHCGNEEQTQEFIKFLETESAQSRLRKLMKQRSPL
jgi:hypothetical protein